MGSPRKRLPPYDELLKLRETRSLATIGWLFDVSGEAVRVALERGAHGPRPRKKAAALEERYTKRDDGHWIWSGSRIDRKGAWESVHGLPPAGALSACPQEPTCVNPGHLVLRRETQRTRADSRDVVAQSLAVGTVSENEIAQARSLREQGVAFAVIARTLGRSREWVYSHVPHAKPMSPERRALAQACEDLRAGGAGMAEISRIQGIPLATVARLLGELAATK